MLKEHEGRLGTLSMHERAKHAFCLHARRSRVDGLACAHALAVHNMHKFLTNDASKSGAQFAALPDQTLTA